MVDLTWLKMVNPRQNCDLHPHMIHWNIFQTHYTWVHIGNRIYFLVGSYYDPDFTFGITSTSSPPRFGKHPEGSSVVSLCEERIISYCRKGKWLPEPKCTGSNIIYICIVSKLGTHKLIVW